MKRSAAILGPGLLGVLVLATVGDAGNRPGILLAWHTLLFATVIASWWFAASSGTGRRPVAGVGLALVLWTLVATIGFVRAPYAYSAWLTLVEMTAFLAMCLTVVRNGAWLISRLGPVLVLAGWVQAGLIVFQRFGLDDPRPAGTFLNPNHLAGWLVAAILFAVGHRIASPGRRIDSWVAIASLPLLGAIVLSGSRGALIGLLAGGALLAVSAWPGLRTAGRVGALASLVVVLVAGAAAVGLRLQQPDPYRYQRLKIWRAAATPLLSSPWFGTGPGQFAREAPNLQFPDGHGTLRYDRGFRKTHSDWLRVGAEFGWPGLAAFCWIVVSVVASVARRWRSGAPPDVGALAGLLALFVHAAFDNLTSAPALYLLGAVFLGLVIGTDAPARRSVSPFWRVMVVVVAGYLFVIGDVAPWKEWSERDSSDSPARHDTWNPSDAEAAMRRAEAMATRGALDWAGYAEVRRLAERAVRLSPQDGSLLRRYARIEAAGVLGLFSDRANRDRVAALFRRSIELQRTNPFVPLELAAFLLDSGDAAGARRASERALEIEPQAAAPRLLLARALLETGDPVRSADLLDTAEALEREHVREAQASAYARDLLTLDPRHVRQVRDAIEVARQLQTPEARFDPGHQEDRAGRGRSAE